MDTQRFIDRFPPDARRQRQRAPLLRVVLLVGICLLPLVAVSDFLTGDILNAGLEMAMLAIFGSALRILYLGRYELAARIIVVPIFLLLGFMAFAIADPTPFSLYRNAFFFLAVFTLSLLLLEGKRLPFALAAIGGLTLPVFALLRLPAPVFGLGLIINQLLTALVLYSLVSLFAWLTADLQEKVFAELAGERAAAAERLAKLETVLDGTADNMQTLNSLSVRVDAIRRLIGEATAALEAINRRADLLEGDSASVSGAAGVIASRIGELNRNIEDESAAQIESSASINEMVASIRSVADSATRRRASMEALAGTADDGMKRLDGLLGFIAQIEGSIGSIQSMVSVINGIAGSTNLLSMNAAIEAAHAGQAGRGFAVVAEEIRKLADTSGKNAKEIGRQLKEVIATITAAADSSGRTRESFGEIRREIDSATDAFREITEATGELAEGGRQILEALKNLGEMSGRVKSGGAEIDAAQSRLAELQASSRQNLAALRGDAESVKAKDAAVLETTAAVAAIGEAAVRAAESLHRKTAELGR
jgi:methyl-accepting chemotaxis protein